MPSNTSDLLTETPPAQGDQTSEILAKLQDVTPKWESFDKTRDVAQVLRRVSVSTPALVLKAMFDGDSKLIAGLHAVLLNAVDGSGEDLITSQFIVTLFFNILRDDSVCYSCFEVAAKNGVQVFDTYMRVLNSQSSDRYVANRASWILSSVMGNSSVGFSEKNVSDLLDYLTSSGKQTGPSTEGVLAAIANLLKSSRFRAQVWRHDGVCGRIVDGLSSGDSQQIYKAVFGLWMLSFDDSILKELNGSMSVIADVKAILSKTRVQKVVRLCLTLLRNLLNNKDMCEDIVETGLLDTVQNLEFEKWRDTELYEDIRDMSQLIGSEVQQIGNFGRYERELQSQRLKWGYIHSSKFFGENIMKFDKDGYAALKSLEEALYSSDPTTQAVACHDIGEFVALHPAGKKKVAEHPSIKEKVMLLMGTTDEASREVRREAILSCQKIMLNRWQEVDK